MFDLATLSWGWYILLLVILIFVLSWIFNIKHIDFKGNIKRWR